MTLPGQFRAFDHPLVIGVLSVGEDVLAIGISYGALHHPLLASAIALALRIAIVASASVLIRALRRR